MKAVILADGFGTRISEESHLRPKPMIEIGGAPILWHIMKFYTMRLMILLFAAAIWVMLSRSISLTTTCIAQTLPLISPMVVQ
jgi:choline kinase